MSVKAIVWRDDVHDRVVPTGFGSVLVRKGETAILVVGKHLDPEAVAALKLLAEPPHPFTEDSE